MKRISLLEHSKLNRYRELNALLKSTPEQQRISVITPSVPTIATFRDIINDNKLSKDEKKRIVNRWLMPV